MSVSRENSWAIRCSDRGGGKDRKFRLGELGEAQSVVNGASLTD